MWKAAWQPEPSHRRIMLAAVSSPEPQAKHTSCPGGRGSASALALASLASRAASALATSAGSRGFLAALGGGAGAAATLGPNSAAIGLTSVGPEARALPPPGLEETGFC